MEVANVSNRLLTQRINIMLKTNYTESYMSQVRQGKEGSAALQLVVKNETTAMLVEAAETAKAA